MSNGTDSSSGASSTISVQDPSSCYYLHPNENPALILVSPPLARVSSRASDDHPRKSDPNPTPPLVFPRSVSPYVSRQKSDYASWQSCDRHNNLFYSTPQLGRAFGTRSSEANSGFHGRTSSSLKKKTGRFWIFTGTLRTIVIGVSLMVLNDLPRSPEEYG